MNERETKLPNSPMQHDGETYGPQERAWSEWTRGPREGYPDRVAHYFAANDDPALVHLAFVAGWNARETSQSEDLATETEIEDAMVAYGSATEYPCSRQGIRMALEVTMRNRKKQA